jgi:hypothetical protein
VRFLLILALPALLEELLETAAVVGEGVLVVHATMASGWVIRIIALVKALA